ncbi:MAG: DsbA family protein [Alphaproteobacteria bacterium]
MVTVDLFWSFRSPYCYLGLPRIQDLERRYAIELAVRVVMPLAVRDPDYFESLPPARGAYNAMDAQRTAAYLGIPFARPQPDPVVFETERRRPAAHQPYIHRLSRLGALACVKDKGMAFIGAVASMMWGGAVVGWDQGDHLASAVRTAGLDLAEMDAEIAAYPERYDAQISDNERRLSAVGHWGVPTLAVEGEAFFGQDRLDVLAWRLDALGARR